MISTPAATLAHFEIMARMGDLHLGLRYWEGVEDHDGKEPDTWYWVDDTINLAVSPSFLHASYAFRWAIEHLEGRPHDYAELPDHAG